MILNFRYHVFTITAIFIALGFGILIGISLFEDDGLIAEQQKIISDIGNQIGDMRDDNRNLRNELNKLETKLIKSRQSQQELLSIFLDDYLSDVNYYIYSSSLTEESKKDFEFFKNEGLCLQLFDCKDNLNFNENRVLDNLKPKDRIVFWNTGQEEDNLKKLYINIGEEKMIECRDDKVSALMLSLIKHERFLREKE